MERTATHSLAFQRWLSPAETMAIGHWLAAPLVSGVTSDELWLFGSRARARSHPE